MPVHILKNKLGKSNKLNINLNTLVNISKENFKILSPSRNYYHETLSIKLRHYSFIYSVVFAIRLLSTPHPCNELKIILFDHFTFLRNCPPILFYTSNSSYLSFTYSIAICFQMKIFTTL